MRLRRRPKPEKVQTLVSIDGREVAKSLRARRYGFVDGYQTGIRFALSLLPDDDRAVSSAALRLALEDRLK